MSLNPQDREKAIQAAFAVGYPSTSWEGVEQWQRTRVTEMVDAALAALSPAEPVQATDPTRAALLYILDQQDTQWAVDPGDMDQRFVANIYATKLERIFARARAALRGESQ